ncbi:MAG: stage II sporulation protein D, partial [Clostridiales bacterium]|nr:stage II sporulation protein D [Clostridiales bacterium]
MRTIFLAFIAFLIIVLIIPLFIINSCDIQIPSKKHIPKTEDVIESDFKINVYNHETKENMELYLEDYITQVVAAEVPAEFELEALKAQAIAARTFVIWRVVTLGDGGHDSHPGASVCT